MSDDLAAILGGGAASGAPDLKALVRSKAAKYGLDPDIADRWAQQESGYDPKAVSKKGAKGILQLMDGTAKELGVTDSFDPEQNIDGGMRYLSDLRKKYGGDLNKTFAAYNAGPSAVDKAGGVPNYPETQVYVKTILGGGAPSGDLASLLGGAASTPAPTTSEGTKTTTTDGDKDYAAAFGDPSKFDEKADMTGMGLVPFKGLEGSSLNKEQTAAHARMVKGNAYRPDDPAGTPYNPLWMTADTTEKDVPPDTYYRDAKGVLKHSPGGEAKSSMKAGLGRGIGDVMLSGAELLPGTEDSELRNRFKTDQEVYDADYKGDFKSGTGRFIGQVAASAPLIAGGEAVVAPRIAAAIPAAAAANPIVRGGLTLAGGAAEGASAAALTSSASDAPLEQQMGLGAVVGGPLKAATPAVRILGQKAGGAVRSFVDPLTAGGRDKIANRIIGEVSGHAPVTPNAAEIIPGSTPTLGQAADNAGIAALERNARTNPKVAERFRARDTENEAARADVYERLKGDEHTVAALEQARDAATGKLREAAFKGAQPADPTAAVAKIDEILAGPSGQRDVVVKALNGIKPKLMGEKGPQTDVEQLYGIRKDIDDALSPLASSEKKGSALASRELLQVKAEIDKAIEGAAPGFKGYLKTYADMSKPVDEQRLLQSLKVTDARGNLTLSRVQSAIDRVEAMRGKAGANKGKSVGQGTLDDLKAIRDDLKRAGNLDAGKARGSDTVQNLVMGKVAGQAGIPLGIGATVAGNPILGAALGAGKMFYGMKSDQVLDALASRLLDPKAAAPVVAKAAKSGGAVKRLAAPVLPAAGGILTNRLVAQPQ